MSNKSKKVSVVVTNRKAVYMDDFRITHRGTKWGVHRTVDSFECLENQVRKLLIERGHTTAEKCIDEVLDGDEVVNNDEIEEESK